MKLPLDPGRWLCSQAKAQSCSLPGSLDKIGEILGLSEGQAKIKDGKRLVLKFCKPAPANHKVRRYTRENSPEEWQAFLDYALRDVEALEAIWNRLPDWNYRGGEVDLWRLDQTINDRGVPVDLELARAAIRATEAEKARLKAVVQDETDGAVQGFGQRNLLLDYLNSTYGLGLEDLKTSTLETVLGQVDLPTALREILYARLRGSKASTAKYKKLIKAANEDGRLRGLLRFNGASRTGRWSGQVFQPQNLPRASLKGWDIELGIEALKRDMADWMYGDGVMDLAASALRGVIVAPEGRQLDVSDLSNIEGRMLAWLAGEAWKLKAFRDYDTFKLDAQGHRISDGKGDWARLGHDLYVLAYAGSFGVPPESVTKDQRQIGKVQELALGYQGGVGAFLTFAAAYGIDLEAMGSKAYASLPTETRDQADHSWDWAVEKKQTYGLSQTAYVVCDGFKRLWRQAHPNVVAFWTELETAVRDAIALPGRSYPVRRLEVRYQAPWLGIRLPSGRILLYFNPRVEDSKNGRGVISYEGINQFNRKWVRLKTYGGKLCIAEGTPVLTRRGWVGIETVTHSDEVWDGETWVQTAGAVNNGRRGVIQAHGAWMTPDHQVLTTEGWKDASQSERFDRAACRLPDGIDVPRVGWEEIPVGCPMPVWAHDRAARDGTPEATGTGYSRVLRVHAVPNHLEEADHARDVEASGLRGMAKHGRPVPTTHAPRLEKLRRAGHSSLRALGRFIRELLGGHESGLHTGPDSGSNQQRSGLPPRELPMGRAEGSGAEQAHQPLGFYPDGADDSRRAFGPDPDWYDDLALPARTRGDRHGFDLRPGCAAQVYDLLNCGPQHRFVIATNDGPLIVHNCENVTQAAARDVLAYAMPRVEAAGYPILLSVHDELITAGAIDGPGHEGLSEILATPPPWAPGLPLAAGGFTTQRYRKG
jgi:DNA polymerase